MNQHGNLSVLLPLTLQKHRATQDTASPGLPNNAIGLGTPNIFRAIELSLTMRRTFLLFRIYWHTVSQKAQDYLLPQQKRGH